MKLCPALAVEDPETFIAGIAAILKQYPDEVVAKAIEPTGIPAHLGELRDLSKIKAICDELHAPVARRLEREAIARQPRALPRPPRTPEEQAAIDAQVAKWRRPSP